MFFFSIEMFMKLGELSGKRTKRILKRVKSSNGPHIKLARYPAHVKN